MTRPGRTAPAAGGPAHGTPEGISDVIEQYLTSHTAPEAAGPAHGTPEGISDVTNSSDVKTTSSYLPTKFQIIQVL